MVKPPELPAMGAEQKLWLQWACSFSPVLGVVGSHVRAVALTSAAQRQFSCLHHIAADAAVAAVVASILLAVPEYFVVIETRRLQSISLAF